MEIVDEGKFQDMMNKIEKIVRDAQVDLEPDAKKVLYENRWELYDDQKRTD